VGITIPENSTIGRVILIYLLTGGRILRFWLPIGSLLKGQLILSLMRKVKTARVPQPANTVSKGHPPCFGWRNALRRSCSFSFFLIRTATKPPSKKGTAMSKKQTRLKMHLKQIEKNDPHSLRAEVAREALHYGGEIETFFSDLLPHGCQSGMIGSLIYYTDTHKFYDKHYYEIESLREALEDSAGSSFG
jgi:hypothetical protein